MYGFIDMNRLFEGCKFILVTAAAAAAEKKNELKSFRANKDSACTFTKAIQLHDSGLTAMCTAHTERMCNKAILNLPYKHLILFLC